jgi:alkylation response protein AidB-like acyl-CoA dehydrogenase
MENPAISQTDVFAAAERLSREYYERADKIEIERRIPPDVSRQMAEAGFYRLNVPAAIGGLEAPPAVSSEVFETLARGDASCAWVAFIGATSGTALASIPPASAAEIFNRPDMMMTGVFAPTGRAEKVEGGFRVSGRWQWGSGSQNADWVLAGCMLMENGEPMLDGQGKPRSHMMILPAGDIEYLDTWHVSGLCGTGSLDYQVEDLFVPEDRAVGYLPGDDTDLTALYAFPNITFLALGIGAVCMGIARAAIDELVQLALQKKRRGANRTIAHKSSAQSALARAEAGLRSARLMYYDALAKAWESAQARGEVSIEQRRDLRMATTHAVMVSASVVDEMYNLGGGASVYKSSRLQRYFRDIHVATQHIMVGPATLETVGSLLFGLETDTSML